MKEPQGSNDQRELETRLRAMFDEAAGDLDPAIAGRLRAARRKALAEAARPAQVVPLFRERRTWYLGGAVAASLLLAVLVAAPWRQAPPEDDVFLADAVRVPQADAATDVAALDLELMSEDVPFDVIEELEFYQWLLEAGQDAG